MKIKINIFYIIIIFVLTKLTFCYNDAAPVYYYDKRKLSFLFYFYKLNKINQRLDFTMAGTKFSILVLRI